MLKKINILFAALLIAINAYGAIVISTYRKPREIKYKYKMTERGKVLIVPKNILFQFNSGELDLKKYLNTVKYVGDVSTSTNIMMIIVEGHTSTDEYKKITNGYDKTDILFLYNRKNIDDLSYNRSYNVYLAVTNGILNKFTNYGLQDLLSEYQKIEENRRVEFILIENSNDMNVYTNYINNLIMSK
ncbi:hypothetical protein [Brachyspira hampsonii]|uniref:Uncharacterized protein n=1 Tax=Brachyspira hampsonii TaxID=1287055 RepID=A0AAC9XKP8_9SPIR|nr:hypothetical protein [Brachyspira hampsonii]ASJ22047.1 hypothetical protein BHAMNSH16_10550 [Brachyspira hampsonii]ELV05092.1 hypothetical protein H263_12254 [Brachyspira hampsonii 30599]MBW5381066.1 hypothetical protein [Brachyspira hampsonii]OEJ17738.1 hypothetical protein A9496_10280 [Brachyspira hampsonii]